MSFGSKIKELRTESNMTQKELSLILDTSTSTIGMYEQDRREPDIKTIISIAKYFNVTTDFLFEIKENKSKKLFAFTDQEQKLIFAYRSKPEMQPAINTLLGLEENEKIILYQAAHSENNNQDGYIKKDRKEWDKIQNAKETEDNLL